MNNDREELIDAMARAIADAEYVRDAGDGHPSIRMLLAAESARISLDALLAHPSAVLAELENAKCPECVEAREQAVAMADGVPALSKETADAISAVLVATSDALGCDACGGSGILGRDGVLRALGMEQVGWGTRWPDGVWYMQPPNLRDDSAVPVFARVPVPEPSEGEKA